MLCASNSKASTKKKIKEQILLLLSNRITQIHLRAWRNNSKQQQQTTTTTPLYYDHYFFLVVVNVMNLLPCFTLDGKTPQCNSSIHTHALFDCRKIMGNSSGANRTPLSTNHVNPDTTEESRLATTSSSSSSDTSFSLPFSELLERPKHKIICGYLKKVGKRLAGTHTRWVAIYSSFQLETCKDEQSESTPTKVYNLMNSNVQYGKLGTGEFALKIYTDIQANKTNKKIRKDQITLLFHNRREMQQWVGGIRCLFAGTENSVLNSSAVGGESCVICLDDFAHSQVLSVLPCNHRFCPDCIRQWLEISSLCPCCKRDATVDGVLVVHTGKYNKEVKMSSSNDKTALASPGVLAEPMRDTSNDKKRKFIRRQKWQFK